MKTNVEGVINAIAEDIRMLVQTIMESGSVSGNQSSIKQLRDTVRKEDIVAKVSSAGGKAIIDVLYDSVLEWDRKPQSGRQPSVSEIKEWAASKGLATDNTTINLIRRSIWWNGHAGQSIIDLLDKEIDRMFEKEWGDMIVDALTKELSEWFD